MWPCASLSFFSEISSACSSAANCRRNAAICWLSTSTCASARGFLLAFELAGEFRHLALRGGGPGAGAFGFALEAVALALGADERGTQLRELVLEIDLARFLHRQQIGELRDLRVEAAERGVLAGDFLLQIELHHHEHGQNEDDGQDQRRQRVDEARPVIQAAFAAARSGKSHCYSRQRNDPRLFLRKMRLRVKFSRAPSGRPESYRSTSRAP